MNNTKIYLDTSVISALFDERAPERRELTKNAWENIRKCEVYISGIVLEELRMAKRPLIEKFDKAIEGFNIVEATDEAKKLASIYVEQGVFPEKYFDDALHVAITSVNGIGLLLSWNFKHLVKLKTRRLVSAINTINNYMPVEIIAPPEL